MRTIIVSNTSVRGPTSRRRVTGGSGGHGSLGNVSGRVGRDGVDLFLDGLRGERLHDVIVDAGLSASTMSAFAALVVTISTGTDLPCGIERRLRTKSMPFISGMFQSVITSRSGLADPVEAFASVAASTTVVAELVQGVDDDATHRGRIIDNEEAHSGPVLSVESSVLRPGAGPHDALPVA